MPTIFLRFTKAVTNLSMDRIPKDHMLIVRDTLSIKAEISHMRDPVSHLSNIVVTIEVGITMIPEKACLYLL